MAGGEAFCMAKRSKAESVAAKIQQRILRGGGDRLWGMRDFLDLDTATAAGVAATLSRLSREGCLRRIRRGVYYRPGKTAFGETQPAAEAVAGFLLRDRKAVRTGEFNRLGLTTQMSNVLTSASDRTVRMKGVGSVGLRFVNRALALQKGIRAGERTVLDSLRMLERIPDATPEQVLSRLVRLIEQGKLDFDRLARFALAEPPRVRALLGAIGETVGVDAGKLVPLRKSLNPITIYRIVGASHVLENSGAWNIK